MTQPPGECGDDVGDKGREERSPEQNNSQGLGSQVPRLRDPGGLG